MRRISCCQSIGGLKWENCLFPHNLADFFRSTQYVNQGYLNFSPEQQHVYMYVDYLIFKGSCLKDFSACFLFNPSSSSSL